MTTLAGSRIRLFTYLDGSGHSNEEVGGKGAGLDKLIAAGLPVPEATVLTAGAYHLAVAEHSLQLLIADLRTSALPAPDHIAAECAAIERTFLTAPLPDDVFAAINRIGEEMLPRGPLAVRSSATAEDMSGASFAGQYLTVTGVSGIDGLERAVRRCWASLWMPAARAYRRRQQISDGHLSMAVVIQTMVDPIWSGVAFTTDLDGGSHLVRVEAVRGLGEALVAGRVTPSDYTIRKDTLEVVGSGGAQPLGFLEELGRLAVELERREQAPQDIEWAYTENGLTLLQIRPITRTDVVANHPDRLDTEPDPDAVYTPHGVIEMLPNVIPPLLWTINAPMLENAFRATLADLGGRTPDRSRRIVSRFRGRAALNLSGLAEIAESLPGGSAAEVERQYLGHTLSDDRPPGRRRAPVLAVLRARKAHNRIVDDVALISAASRGLNSIRLDLRTLPVRRLVAYRQRIRDLAWRGYTAEVGASSAAAASFQGLEALLARWMPECEAAEWAQRTTSGALARSAVGAARAKVLADVITNHATDAVKAAIAGGVGDLKARIAAIDPDGPPFLAALDDAVNAMGSRAMYGDVTWAEDDWWIWRQLQLLLIPRPPSGEDEEDDELADLCHRLSDRRRWRSIRVLTGQFIDLRLRLLRRQVRDTIRFLELREQAKNALLVLGGEERRIIREAADRLTTSGMLAHPDRVELLTDTELDAMLFGRCQAGGPDLRARQQLTQFQAGSPPLPDWFTGDPDRAEPAPVSPAHRLEGWAAGPGRAEGTACIIRSLADGTRLKRGNVLVAHATDPSWTPLLLTAGAVVLETGGPLAHAAIVAREFGLPAVLNVPSATRLLHDGELVEVDGTLGTITRIDMGGEA